MEIREAYNSWAPLYDTNENKTRDLEAQAMREKLATIPFENCLEIGCGTGKNTGWLIANAKSVTAVDLSDEMLAKAREKISTENVQFMQADITSDWTFRNGLYDLVTFSLVLEHIENLDYIFLETAASLQPGGYVYIGELHSFKQYAGSKARYDNGSGEQIVQCYTHHISDFVRAAKKYGLQLADLEEYFDSSNRTDIPRILVLLFRKS